MSALPLEQRMHPTAAAALAIWGAAGHFAATPNGRPRTLDEFLSILVLAAQEVPEKDADIHIVGAKVQLARLGFKGHKLPLSHTDKLSLYLLWLFRSTRSEPTGAKRPRPSSGQLKTGHGPAMAHLQAMSSLRGALHDLGATPRTATSDMWARTAKLWDGVLELRADHEQECRRIEKTLRPLLPDGLELAEHQLDMVRCIETSNFRFLLTDDMGLGKAQPEDSGILTPGGWKRLGDIRVGSSVIDPDTGKPCTVTGVYPQGDREIFRVTLSDGTSTRCCAEHLWHVYTPNDRIRGNPGRVLSLQQIMEQGIKAIGVRRGIPEERRKWFLPISLPVEFAVDDHWRIPLPPYLLGVLIGDGGLTGDVPRLSCPDLEVITRSFSELPDGVSGKPVPKTCDWRLSADNAQSKPNPLTEHLRDLGLMGCLSIDKFIPEDYMRRNTQDRIALLQGLMDTDGDCTLDGTSIFNTSSVQLRDAVIDLVRGLGGIATCSTKENPRYEYKGEKRIGHPAYRVNVRTPFNPFSLPRKASRWKPPILARSIESIESIGVERCLCISVDSQRNLYITDDYIVTHNTIEILAALLLLGNDAFPIVIAAPLSVTYNWQREIEKWMAKRQPVVHRLQPHTCGKAGDRPCSVCRVFDRDVPAGLEAGQNLVLIGSWQQMITHHRALMALHPRTAVGDEFHYISNHMSQRAQAFLRIRGRAVHVLGATGTLEPNGRHREAYGQIKAVAPGAFTHLVPAGARRSDGLPRGDWRAYAQRYCGPVRKHLGKRSDGKPRIRTSYDGRSNDVEFGWVLAQYTLRRTKAEVFGEDGMPAKTRYRIPVPISNRDRLRIAGMRDTVRAKLLTKARELEVRLREERLPQAAIDERVRRVISSQAMTELSAMRLLIGHLKIRWTMDRLKELLRDGHDAIVFCDHNEVADAVLARAIKAFGEETVLRGRGSMNGKQRGELIDRAQTDDQIRIIVLTRAFREGITLTKFDRIIMVQRWWVPGDEAQAEDRPHRIGQEREVGIDYPVIEGSCDDAMSKLAIWKEAGQQQVQGAAQVRLYEWILSGDSSPETGKDS